MHDQAYFDTYANGSAFDRQRAIDALKRIDYIGKRGIDLLEIGSGAGHFLNAAARAGFRPVGIEQSAYAAEHGPADTLPVHVGLVEDAPLEPASFDVVCAWHVIEHLPDPVSVLSRLHSALRSGGRICLEVPNFMSARSRKMGADWPSLFPAHHAGQHSPRSLHRLLESAGFREVSIQTVMPMAYLTLHTRMTPRKLAQRTRYSLVAGTVRLTHPTRHDLLRATALRR